MAARLLWSAEVISPFYTFRDNRGSLFWSPWLGALPWLEGPYSWGLFVPTRGFSSPIGPPRVSGPELRLLCLAEDCSAAPEPQCLGSASSCRLVASPRQQAAGSQAPFSQPSRPPGLYPLESSRSAHSGIFVPEWEGQVPCLYYPLRRHCLLSVDNGASLLLPLLESARQMK